MAKFKIDIKDIKRYIGQEVGISGWMTITQSRVNKFAEATGDFQWIHVDEERVKSKFPSGQTVVHNFLLLSLIPQFFDHMIEFTGLSYGINRGAENINFLQSLSTNSNVRVRLKITKLEYVDQKGMTVTFLAIMEREGCDRPVMTVDLKLLLVTG